MLNSVTFAALIKASVEETPLRKVTLNNCPVCTSALGDGSPQLQTYDPFKVSDQPFTYVECDNCKCWILNPRPELSEMGQFYADDFLFNTNEEANPNKGLLAKLSSAIQEFNMESEVSFAAKHLKDGDKYLDYSAGNGQILDLVRRRRPNCTYHATEFSQTYRDYLNTLMDPSSVKQELSDFDADQKFNVISFFGVLEHVQDPRDLIQQMRDRLEDGGKLVLSVPNVKALQRSMFGSKWYSWLAPRHWQMFNIKSLKRLVEELGFEVIEEKHFFLRTCSSTLVISMFPSIDPLQAKSKLGLILYGLLFYFFLPLEWFAGLFKKSGFMGIAAKKKG